MTELSSRSKTARAPSEPEARISVGPIAIGVTALVLAALWLVDFYVLKTPLLTRFKGEPPLTPLYAFWSPLLRPEIAVFAALGALFAFLAPRLSDPARMRRAAFAGALACSAIALAFALFLARQSPAELGRQFLIYPNEEFYADALRILDVSDFLREYVRLMPSLSLHGQHFPPGHAVLLYTVKETIGPGTAIAGAVILVIFATGMVVAFLALARLVGEHAARQGACLLLACPSLLDFACTSMDAVFFALAMLCFWLATRAAANEAKLRHSIALGAALALASCFSFSTFPLGMAIGLYISWSSRRSWRTAVARLLAIGATFALCLVTLYAATGFALWTCVEIAHEKNYHLMTRALGRDPYSIYVLMCYGNAAAFLIGSGLALVPAAAARIRTSLREHALRADPWTPPILLALAIMSFGGIYFMETERIGIYAMPWLAALGTTRTPFTPATLSLLLTAGLTQTLAMESFLFTLW